MKTRIRFNFKKYIIQNIVDWLWLSVLRAPNEFPRKEWLYFRGYWVINPFLEVQNIWSAAQKVHFLNCHFDRVQSDENNSHGIVLQRIPWRSFATLIFNVLLFQLMRYPFSFHWLSCFLSYIMNLLHISY